MTKYKTLFLDESGKSTYSHHSKYFVLSACSVLNDKLEELRGVANQIIFKYWGTKRRIRLKWGVTDIIFHSKDLARKAIGTPFEILRSPKKENEFWKDVNTLLLSPLYLTFFIVVSDKYECKRLYWREQETILRKSYQFILEKFVKNLITSKYMGQVVAESSVEQDKALVTVMNTFSRSGVKNIGIDGKKFHETITSFAFVNKLKNDIGTQIADIMAWVGRNKHLLDKGKSIRLSTIEKKRVDFFNRKLTLARGKSFYKAFP